jgi:hypothetical protein
MEKGYICLSFMNNGIRQTVSSCSNQQILHVHSYCLNLRLRRLPWMKSLHYSLLHVHPVEINGTCKSGAYKEFNNWCQRRPESRTLLQIDVHGSRNLQVFRFWVLPRHLLSDFAYVPRAYVLLLLSQVGCSALHSPPSGTTLNHFHSPLTLTTYLPNNHHDDILLSPSRSNKYVISEKFPPKFCIHSLPPHPKHNASLIVTFYISLKLWRWRQYVPPKHYYVPTNPQSVITQMTSMLQKALVWLQHPPPLSPLVSADRRPVCGHYTQQDRRLKHAPRHFTSEDKKASTFITHATNSQKRTKNAIRRQQLSVTWIDEAASRPPDSWSYILSK